MLNSNKFTFVNVCFQYERNDDSGLYGQTLIIVKLIEQEVRENLKVKLKYVKTRLLRPYIG